MKKIINLFMVLVILTTFFMPLSSVSALTCDGYKLSTMSSNGTVTDIKCYAKDAYTTAKADMIKHASTSTLVAVLYNANGKLINAKYAVAKLADKVIYMYPNTTTTSKYTAVHGGYGRDVAYLDYDPISDRALVRISGYSGWVYMSNITEVIPVSGIQGSYATLIADGIRVRTAPSTGTIIGTVNSGAVFRYYGKESIGLHTWYKIIYNGQTAYIADKDKLWIKESVGSGLQTFYTKATTGNLLHYYEYAGGAQSFTNLGTSPSYIKQDVPYYSFDGVYFYSNLTSMLDNYRSNKNNGEGSINVGKPHYAYYMYLPMHSKTGYLAEDLDQYVRNAGFYKEPDPLVKYVNYDPATSRLSWVSGINRDNMSLLVNQGKHFIGAANTYGINALMMFGVAYNESSKGTSAIAFYKNNLFGYGANDSNPVDGAYSYATPRDSIYSYALNTGSPNSGYSNPLGNFYFGSHYGNKGSGIAVNYATDPYWGEKQAAYSFYADRDFGLQDWDANTIGVTTRTNVPIRKTPSSMGTIIYNLKNKNFLVEKIPVIVADKVFIIENGLKKGFYKVYSDTPLDDNQNIANVPYTFANSYGYIAESDLYVANNQPVITAADKIIPIAKTPNLLEGVTATDVEDGNLTSKIVVESSNIQINVPGVYKVTYKVEDDSFYAVTKTINVTVSGSDSAVIKAADKEVSQYVTFDPLQYVTANDFTGEDLTSAITVYANNVDTTKLGTYQVTYRVINSIGKITDKTINVYVMENKKPVINATDKTVTVNTIFNPLSQVSASDFEDGNITSQIQVTNNVNMAKAGVYSVIYSVTDKAGQTVSKTIKVTVEDKVYTVKTGDFYFNKMDFTNNKLVVEGSLAILGMNNLSTTPITYDLILKDNLSSSEYVLPLERWLVNHPTRAYTNTSYTYTKSWFKGSLDLSGVPASEYTIYVRARSGNFESKNLFRNMFAKTTVRKAVDSTNNRGYLFRNNTYKSSFPIELFIRDDGLISKVNPPHLSNMYNNYQTLSMSDGKLNIVGTSYNINGDYSSSASVERYLILENKDTFVKYTYNIGSYVGTDVPLRVSDGKSKVRAWFNTTGKVDLSTLPEGKYIIYVHTKSGTVDDFGELNDVFMKNISNPSVSTNIKTSIYNGRNYTISLNKNARFRLELNISK